MGYSTSIAQAPGKSAWSLVLKVVLTRAESNDLFLSGDSMVSWPTEGLQQGAAGDSMPERSGMFVSEIAARPSGLTITYKEQAQAERAATLMRMQFAQIGIDEER